jgi:hypothetical protein
LSVAGPAVLAASLLVPGFASAATLGTNGSTLEYRASPGETNRFFPEYRRNRDFYSTPQLAQFGPKFGNVVARPPCSSGNDPDVPDFPTPIASCPAGGLKVADVQLGDGNDTFQLFRDEIYRPDGEHDDALVPIRPLRVNVDGGPGNDSLEAGAGEFPDVLLGGPGDDDFLPLGGNDLIRGGPGKDGAPGGPGNDRMYGDSGADVLFGEGGIDRIYGGSGNDRINGGGFAFGTDRRDTMYGGSGADRLTDVQNGKETAGDRFFGGTGNDRIDDRDGNRDIIDCGPGRDSVIADQLDKVARNCERVRRKFRRPPG